MTVLTVHKNVVLDLAVCARYDEAIELLGSYWPGLAVEPAACEPGVMYSIGVLNTNLGFSEQNPRAQEVAKDCFSRASRGLKGDERDQCDMSLAIAYWRSGDEEEALIQFTQILERPLSPENRFRGLHGCAVVLGSLGRHKEEAEYLAKARPFLDEVSIAFRGRFHLEAAMNNRRLGGDLNQSITDYRTALICFKQVKAEILEASVHNNLCAVYIDLKDFHQAHDHVEKAIEITARLGDKGRLAQCHDEQARIFLAQGQPKRAAQCAHDSIQLISGPVCGWAIDSRITYGTALARIGDPRAIEEFAGAIGAARRQENRIKETEAALGGLEELDLDVPLMLEWLPLAERSDQRKRVISVRRKVAEKLVQSSHYEEVKLAMIEHKGNIKHAARALGYNHHTGLLPYLNKHPELRIKKRYNRTRR